MEAILIGIDLGGTSIQGAASRPDGTILNRARIPTRSALGPETVLDDLVQLVKKLAGKCPLRAVGLGVPGLLDLEQGICLFSGNLGWENVPVVAKLSAAIGAPVFLDNDVRVAALGELAQGEARGCSNFIYLAVGTGIGSGIFIAGQLLRGPHWSAGEVGHMVLDPLGPDCNCGSRGCLEALASATAIAREGRAAAAADADSLLRQLAKTPDAIDAALVFEAAACGDQGAAQVVNTAMTWLGIGVANLVNIFNPELVVIGGGVSLAGEKLLAPVGAQISRFAMPVQKKTVRLATSALGDRAGVAGALELARQNKGADR
jgi:glucokinase